MIYDYAGTERRVAAGVLSRHEADILHGYAAWLRMRAAGDYSVDPTEDTLVVMGARRRGDLAIADRVAELVDVPAGSPRELLERGDNRHAAWRLVYAARGDDYPGQSPGDDRLEALVDQLHRDGWHR